MNALAIFSVASIFAGLNIPSTPSFERDYSLAHKAAVVQHKPIAVFIAAGETGWQKLTREGGLSPAASKAPFDNYVCVFANTETPAGQKTAAAFGLTGQSGLVISDRTGDLQAFRHSGQLSQDELSSRLVKYADANRVATTTETVAPPAAVLPAGFYGGCPNCRR